MSLDSRRPRRSERWIVNFAVLPISFRETPLCVGADRARRFHIQFYASRGDEAHMPADSDVQERGMYLSV